MGGEAATLIAGTGPVGAAAVEATKYTLAIDALYSGTKNLSKDLPSLVKAIKSNDSQDITYYVINVVLDTTAAASGANVLAPVVGKTMKQVTQGIKALNGSGVGNKTFDYYMNLVDNLDVTTKPNTATFYSGKGNRALAEEFAKVNGKTTLEMTPGGKYLDDLKLFGKGSPLTEKQATEVWKKLSRKYAENASGNVWGFVKGSNPGSVFNTVEYPALKTNPNISNVFTELMK